MQKACPRRERIANLCKLPIYYAKKTIQTLNTRWENQKKQRSRIPQSVCPTSKIYPKSELNRNFFYNLFATAARIPRLGNNHMRRTDSSKHALRNKPVNLSQPMLDFDTARPGRIRSFKISSCCPSVSFAVSGLAGGTTGPTLAQFIGS